MILINRTYSVVTPESAENGEEAESGMLATNEAVTFRELVSIMQDHPVPSCWPAGGSTYEWLSCHPEHDYRDCSDETRSIHFSRENKPDAAKYWRKAMIAAGIAKLK